MSRGARAEARGSERLDTRPAPRRRTRRPPASYPRQKRLLDIFVCLVALPFAVPVLLLCAVLVKATSRGPVLFIQERTGLGGRRFKMLKFRTMVPDAPRLRDALKGRSRIAGPDFKLSDDPRVTRVGDFLRKTSLDEAPQIWNVLRGDMSLVGPRPTSFDATTYALWHTERLEVKPGLTGLWQVEARGDIDFDERVRRDIDYIRHRSLALDVSILLRTIPAVLARRGAY